MADTNGSSAAVDPPVIGSDGVPDKCLSLTIRADWGHFRRIDRTVTKQTYRLPPRTTVAGMCAAMVGAPRDSYYEVFGDGVSAVAITPLGPIRTNTQPTLGLSTNPNETLKSAGKASSSGVSVAYPDSTANRQRHSYEVLIQPAYRIDVAVEDGQFYRSLHHHLENGTSHYPVSMGLSEYLAWIEYHGEYDVEPVAGVADGHDNPDLDTDGEASGGDGAAGQSGSATVALDSALPSGAGPVVPQAGVQPTVERVPGFMRATRGGRTTTGYVDYTFTTGDAPMVIRADAAIPIPTAVGGRIVAFS